MNKCWWSHNWSDWTKREIVSGLYSWLQHKRVAVHQERECSRCGRIESQWLYSYDAPLT